MSTLSERAMLAHLKIPTWSGNVTDREVSDEVSANHNAERDAGSYTKVLVARRFRSDIERTRTRAINAHKAVTLPWYDKGPRALNVHFLGAYTEAMRLERHANEAAREQFLKIYPQEPMAEAKVRLGSMFNPDEYPSVDEIRERFDFKVELSPLPESSDFRVALSASTVKALKADYEKEQDERINAALNSVFQRVCDVTEKMAEKLRAFVPAQGSQKQKDGFHSSIVFNISELADVLPSLNITGDKRLDKIQAELAELTKTAPQILKVDEALRRATADKAQKLFEKVNGYFA